MLLILASTGAAAYIQRHQRACGWRLVPPAVTGSVEHPQGAGCFTGIKGYFPAGRRGSGAHAARLLGYQPAPLCGSRKFDVTGQAAVISAVDAYIHHNSAGLTHSPANMHRACPPQTTRQISTPYSWRPDPLVKAIAPPLWCSRPSSNSSGHWGPNIWNAPTTSAFIPYRSTRCFAASA